MRFKTPQLNEKLPAPGEHQTDITAFLAERRSTPIKTFDRDGNGPPREELLELLKVAMRVPDHRRLGPWRAIIISGEARETFGDLLAKRFKDLNPDVSEQNLELEQDRLMRAPVCVVIVSSPVNDGKTPVWEQELSAGALCMNLLYVSHAAGYAAAWLTEWWAFDNVIADALGLASGERIAGNIFLGTSQVDLFERPRPAFETRVSDWTSPA